MQGRAASFSRTAGPLPQQRAGPCAEAKSQPAEALDGQPCFSAYGSSFKEGASCGKATSEEQNHIPGTNVNVSSISFVVMRPHIRAAFACQEGTPGATPTEAAAGLEWEAHAFLVDDANRPSRGATSDHAAADKAAGGVARGHGHDTAQLFGGEHPWGVRAAFGPLTRKNGRSQGQLRANVELGHSTSSPSSAAAAPALPGGSKGGTLQRSSFARWLSDASPTADGSLAPRPAAASSRLPRASLAWGGSLLASLRSTWQVRWAAADADAGQAPAPASRVQSQGPGQQDALYVPLPIGLSSAVLQVDTQQVGRACMHTYTCVPGLFCSWDLK